MKTTRETIIRVSFQLFLRKSFKEVTIKEIVENAGVSQGAFFHYFKTKDELFLEIVENALQTVLEVHLSKLDRSSLHNYYHDYIEWLTGEGRDFDLNYFSLFFDALKLFPHFREKLAETQQEELDAWVKVIHVAKSKVKS
ncbi:TetR/AcrR family transcriptional regulator [Paenibacillus sp. sptzw28]|uniref:TetR/AcrR family transcriptional regulator n=1 Tax=Paenibacillus sp. sptzw28 TaxID=715179 RepID=UPI001C6F00DE|nr:TetR/AcrR family transcriptional regulator [Paenibacillus sp. sptzw28]QYR21373.1 TetR/AcrR family transcriptional regulator [Paenibacillus sp. sptzw28]